MEIVNYIHFTEPGEKEKLKQLVLEANSEMELRSKITKTFKVNSLDAGVIAKRCRIMFNQIKQQ